jgi:hypothetical protein
MMYAKSTKWMVYFLFAVIMTMTGYADVAAKTAPPPPLPPSKAIISSQEVFFGGPSTNSGNESSNFVTIGDLASMNDSQSDQQITTASSGRIMVSGHISITVYSPGSAYDIQGICRLMISDGSGPTNGLTAMDRGSEWHTVTPSTSNLVFTIPMVGAAIKPAGTYNVLAQCFQTFGVSQATGISAILDDMVVWEGAQ